MPRKVAVLPGDGIGPEVVAEAVKVLKAAGADLCFEQALVGGAAYDDCGNPLPLATLELCKKSDAVLFGAVGGPKWDRIEPASLRPEVGALLPLRKELGLYANVRPARTFRPLLDASPLRGERGLIDLVVVRELTGGIYFGKPRERRDGGSVAVDTCLYSRAEVERIALTAFQIARQRRGEVVSVDKANVLETSRLWREVVTELAAAWPDLKVSHMLVDNCAMQLVRHPRQFDVILTENMFGDILSDEASMVTGSLGMLPSASLGRPRNSPPSDSRSASEGGAGEGDPGGLSPLPTPSSFGAAGQNEEGALTFGLYEPIHGSAPDIAGQGLANPLAAILSAAMMMRYSFGNETSAQRIEAAVEKTLEDGFRTADIHTEGTRLVSTIEMGDAVVSRLA